MADEKVSLRIKQHPILDFDEREPIPFTFEGTAMQGRTGDTIAAALQAAGIKVLGYYFSTARPRGFYCAIGNCSSCLMIVNGKANVRTCTEPLESGMVVLTQRGRGRPMIYEPDVAVIGGGPAGLMAAATAANSGANVLLRERDGHLGGQLVKQTHKFFGSDKQYASTRGIQIAKLLGDRLVELPDHATVWTNATALGLYEDGILTVEHKGTYRKIRPKRIIAATGASERYLSFPNNDLPGIYGAGAVQTLMNVYGIRPGKRVLMIGAGSIGLIVSYQLLQAGVEVAAIVEGLPTISGYLVHASKIRRTGIPILTSHTIVRADGTHCVESALIAKVDRSWNIVAGTKHRIDCDVICISVGLSPLAELLWQAGCDMRYIKELGGHVPVRDETLQTTVPGLYIAGDVSGIEEASAAMVEGHLPGLEAASSLGYRTNRYEEERRDCLAQLDSLRAGPAGEKILSGLNSVGCSHAKSDKVELNVVNDAG